MSQSCSWAKDSGAGPFAPRLEIFSLLGNCTPSLRSMALSSARLLSDGSRLDSDVRFTLRLLSASFRRHGPTHAACCRYLALPKNPNCFLATVSTGSGSDLVIDESQESSGTRSLPLPVLTVSKSDVRLLTQFVIE